MPGNVNVQSSVRAAAPGDADGIYTLLCEAFGDNYLSYTIYQSSRSVKYLASLVALGSTGGQHIMVADIAGRVVGYYHSVVSAVGFFLNYIVVAEAARGSGVGRVLFEHFEHTGQALGCANLLLDVFQSNVRVLNWYARQGYEPISEAFRTKLILREWNPDSCCKLVCERTVWRDALQKERDCGFSKLPMFCESGQGKVTVGLIAGHVCSLVDRERIDETEAILAVAERLRGSRDSLVLSTLAPVPPDWPVGGSERVIRMRKRT